MLDNGGLHRVADQVEIGSGGPTMPIQIVRLNPEPGGGIVASVDLDVVILIELVGEEVRGPRPVAAKRLGDADDALWNIGCGREGFC